MKWILQWLDGDELRRTPIGAAPGSSGLPLTSAIARVAGNEPAWIHEALAADQEGQPSTPWWCALPPNWEGQLRKLSEMMIVAETVDGDDVAEPRPVVEVYARQFDNRGRLDWARIKVNRGPEWKR